MQKKSITEENISPRMIHKTPWRLASVKALEDYSLDVEFMDGTRGVVDMKKLILGKKAGVFAQLKDPDLFAQVFLVYGVTTWPGEIDLAPDAMYNSIKQYGKWVLT